MEYTGSSHGCQSLRVTVYDDCYVDEERSWQSVGVYDSPYWLLIR